MLANTRSGVPVSTGGTASLRQPFYKPRRLACRAAKPNSRPGSGNDSDGESPSTSGRPAKELKIPARGYFAIADTKAEVYSRAGDKFDPMKKGGRYKPEFIWNTDWQTALEREESLRRKVEAEKAKPKEPTSGFLSLSRVAELDRMDVDLSDVLVRKRKEEEELKAAAAAAREAKKAPRRSAPAGAGGPSRTAAVPVFTRKEVSRLERTGRSMARTAVVVEIPELDAEKEAAAAEERVRYEADKLAQTLLTLAFSAVGFAATYYSYSSDVAASYTVGALGGFAYLRLLSKSVDAIGASEAEGAMGGMAAQPRLLIPVILGLGYNRFNQLYSDDLGVTLQLLPMLVGFFTYKLALITKQYKDVFDKM